MTSVPLAIAALTPIVALLLGVGLGLRVGSGDRRLLEHRLKTAAASVARLQHFAETGQPDRVLAVLARAAADGAGDPGVLLDAVLGEPAPTLGTTSVEPAGRQVEVGDTGTGDDVA